MRIKNLSILSIIFLLSCKSTGLLKENSSFEQNSYDSNKIFVKCLQVSANPTPRPVNNQGESRDIVDQGDCFENSVKENDIKKIQNDKKSKSDINLQSKTINLSENEIEFNIEKYSNLTDSEKNAENEEDHDDEK